MNIESYYYQLYSHKFTIKKFRVDLIKIIQEIIFRDKQYVILQEVENYHHNDRLSVEKIDTLIKEVLRCLQSLNLRFISKKITNIKQIKKLEEYLQIKFTESTLELDENSDIENDSVKEKKEKEQLNIHEYQNKNFDSLSKCIFK